MRPRSNVNPQSRVWASSVETAIEELERTTPVDARQDNLLASSTADLSGAHVPVQLPVVLGTTDGSEVFHIEGPAWATVGCLTSVRFETTDAPALDDGELNVWLAPAATPTLETHTLPVAIWYGLNAESHLTTSQCIAGNIARITVDWTGAVVGSALAVSVLMMWSA